MVRRRVRRSTRSSTRSRRSSTAVSTRPTGRQYVTDALVESIATEIVDRLALEDVGIKPSDIIDVIRPIVESIADQYSSRPSKEQILNRILRHQDKLLEIIAAYLLESRDELDEAQLEFVVFNASPQLVARHIQRLYDIARRLGRGDIVDVLKTKWLESGYATPYQCPVCGFYALTPDFTCIVCGADVDEEEYKKFIGFEELFRNFVEESDIADLMDVLSERKVAFDGTQLIPPSRASRNMLVFHLKGEEVKIVEEALSRKKGATSHGI